LANRVPDPQPKPRRWTVIASGLLCGLLALVVIFTNPSAFFSPLALVVVAAIGLAAVLLQLRFRNRDQAQAVHPPLWLNFLGILFALAALFADFLHLNVDATNTLALAAVTSFAISGAMVLHAFRKRRLTSK
jgi:drug/metabolite transporter (DMT)-like permease